MFKKNEKNIKGDDGVHAFMFMKPKCCFQTAGPFLDIHGRSLYIKVDIPPRRLYWAKQN